MLSVFSGGGLEHLRSLAQDLRCGRVGVDVPLSGTPFFHFGEQSAPLSWAEPESELLHQSFGKPPCWLGEASLDQINPDLKALCCWTVADGANLVGDI